MKSSYSIQWFLHSVAMLQDDAQNFLYAIEKYRIQISSLAPTSQVTVKQCPIARINNSREL